MILFGIGCFFGGMVGGIIVCFLVAWLYQERNNDDE